jgi:hypothetical protein
MPKPLSPELTPDDRLREVAVVLAQAVRRVKHFSPPPESRPEKLPKSSPEGLEVSAKPWLSVAGPVTASSVTGSVSRRTRWLTQPRFGRSKMKLDIEREVCALRKMSVGQLRERYAEFSVSRHVKHAARHRTGGFHCRQTDRRRHIAPPLTPGPAGLDWGVCAFTTTVVMRARRVEPVAPGQDAPAASHA